MDAVVRCFQVRSTGKPEPYPTVAEALARFRREKGFLWADILRPTRETLAPFAEALGLSDLTVEDCVDDVQIPKAENYDNYTFVLFNPCLWRDGTLAVGESDIIVGRDFLITVHTPPPEAPDMAAGFDEFMARGLQAKKLARGPDSLAHLVLDFFVERMFSAVEAIHDEIDRAEDVVLESPDSFDPGDLLDVRRAVLKLRKILYHERELMFRLARRDSPLITERSAALFRDLFDQLAKYHETAEIEREMVGNLMDLHMASANNRLAEASNRINMTMRKLTAITVIFMPLTFLSGALGMSEFTMMTGDSNWPAAYGVFFAASVAFALIGYLFMRIRGWI